MSKMNLYVFSGLGTDERIFKNIHFPESINVHFVPWKKPINKEPLENYINRLLKEFDLTQPIILVGLSFGGVIAQEIAERIHPIKTIIISSISDPSELPWYFKLFGKLKLNRIIPFGILKFSNAGINWFFGVRRGEDKNLMAEIIKDADVALLKWSVDILLNWKREKPIEPLFHIHGNQDKLLPLRNKNVNVIIQEGGHLMIYNKAEEIEKVLNEQLEIGN